MPETNYTAVNAKTISINGVPISGSGSPPAGAVVTRFSGIDAISAIALNGTIVGGALGPGQGFTNFDHVDVGDLELANVDFGSAILAVATLKGYFPGGASNVVNVQSDGVVTAESTISRFPAPVAIPANSLRIVYNNGYMNAGEQLGPNAINVKGELRRAGVVYQAVLNGGRTASVDPGAVLVSDPLTHPAIAAGEFVDIWNYVSVSSGQRWPVGRIFNAQRNAANTPGTNNPEGCNRQNTSGYGGVAPLNSDQLSDGGNAGASPAATFSVMDSGGAGYCYGPVMILAPVPASTPRGIMMGSSIDSGVGDTGIRTRTNREIGWINVLMEAKGYPYLNAARSGDSTTTFITGRTQRMALFNLAKPTFAIAGAPTNDITGGPTLAAVQANDIATWVALKAAGDGGVKVYACTLLPRSNTSNVPVTGFAAGGVKELRNAWIRDGAPINFPALTAAAVGASGAGIRRFGDTDHPAFAYLDCGAAVEDPANKHLWLDLANDAPDGVHPAAPGVAKIVAGVTAGFNP